MQTAPVLGGPRLSLLVFFFLLAGGNAHASTRNFTCGSEVALNAQSKKDAGEVAPMFKKRGAGVLVPVSSLPGDHGIGDFGTAYDLLKWLHEAKQKWWQVLPLNPADSVNSPFSSDSAFALDSAYLDIDDLVSLKLLNKTEAAALRIPQSDRADFAQARKVREKALDLAFGRVSNRSPLWKEFMAFRQLNRYWLRDHSSFMVLKETYGFDFTQWPPALKDHEERAVAGFRRGNIRAVTRVEFEQFLLDRQWSNVRKRANSLGISVIGDMPLYVTRFSANVWAHPEAFMLDADKRPLFLSGYPSCSNYPTGQLWGTPVYSWADLEKSDYRFWEERVRRNLALYDAVRIDHFLGLHQFYAVDAQATDASQGVWMEAGGTKLLKHLRRVLGKSMPLVAEDLGASVPVEVHDMKKKFGIPGMYIVQFGHGGGKPDPYHELSTYKPEGIAYTGNHDMPTLVEWIQASSGLASTDEWDWIENLLNSKANIAIVPIQDLLGLGAHARFNMPGTWSSALDPGLRRDNWVWKLRRGELSPALAARMAGIVSSSNR